jgi:hypothetical protein
VGYGGTIVHWDGGSWSPFPSGTTQDLIGTVWGTGPADVWAVGAAGTVAHWNGSVWSASRVDNFPVLFGVWGSGPNDVWAVGVSVPPPGVVAPDQHIAHWDGSAWSATASGTQGVFGAWEALFGVWGSGPNDVWAVGSKGTIVHWDGSTWSPSPSGTTEQLFDVWGSGPNDVWVIGRNGTLLHWDGAVWSRRFIPRI